MNASNALIGAALAFVPACTATRPNGSLVGTPDAPAVSAGGTHGSVNSETSEPVSSQAAASTAANVQCEAPALRRVAPRSPGNVQFVDVGERAFLLAESCLVPLDGDTFREPFYPLPQPSCREPLSSLRGTWPDLWLVAGPEVWAHDATGWTLRNTFTGAARISVGLGATGSGLALVVPHAKDSPTRVQPPFTYYMHRVQRLSWAGPLPKPTAAQDKSGECHTQLGSPLDIHVADANHVRVFGNGCSGDYAPWLESWDGSSSKSQMHKLPLGSDHVLSQARVISNTEMWIAGGPQLMRWDGSTWHEEPGPWQALGLSIVDFVVSPSRSWVIADDFLYFRCTDGDWSLVPLPTSESEPERIQLDSTGAVWVYTREAVLTSRELAPTDDVCKAVCPPDSTFWHEEQRMRRYGRGD